MASTDTIYALSSGGLPSGVAVVRLSGPESLDVLKALTGDLPEPRQMARRTVCDPRDDSLLDDALVCLFRGPASFTGEDVAELHLHGGNAVVAGVLEAIGSRNGTRLAEAGEFSRRAFENGKLDLTEAEGLADLVMSETAAQRAMALSQASGKLREKLDAWRARIIRMRAYIEAEFDFSDEEAVPDSMLETVAATADEVIAEIGEDLEQSRIGEILRSGYRIALMGPPNAGKSSLLNALAKRDAAIVSDEAGTTRDLIEVRMDINGVAVILTDTAGLRKDAHGVEAIGIEKAYRKAAECDLVLWLSPVDCPELPPAELTSIGIEILQISSKSDSARNRNKGFIPVSVRIDQGLDDLVAELSKRVSILGDQRNSGLINRERHRLELSDCLDALMAGRRVLDQDMVIASEHFRSAAQHLGRLTGRVDVEDLLDVIFSEFCIGK